MPWDRSEVTKIPFIVLPTFSSKRDFTATSDEQASLARSPIRFCNHKTQHSAPSTHNWAHAKVVEQTYAASRWTKGRESTSVDQRQDLLYDALVTELVEKIN